MDPPEDASAAVCGNHFERSAQQQRCECFDVSALAGRDDQLDRGRVVGPGQLGVAGKRVDGIERQNGGEVDAVATDEIEAEMIRERTEAVESRRVDEQLLDECELVVVELSPGLDAPHGHRG